MSEFSVSTEWLREQIKRGEAIFLVEVRHAADLDLAVMKARGALRLSDADAAKRLDEIPKERTVVVYSTAPTDQPAEQVARLLYSGGNNEVHLLSGGWHAYLSEGLPVEEIGEGRNMQRLRGF